MKYFLDENFPKKVNSLLQNNEIIDIRGTEFEGSSDYNLFKIAQQNQAIFLTTDKDFYHTIPHLLTNHYGTIVLALKNPSSEKILDRFKWFITNYDITDCRDKCYLITEQKCYLFSKNFNS